LASDDANWSLGHKPISGEVPLYDSAVSANNCSWDYAIADLGGFTLTGAGGGAVVQGAVDFGYGNFLMAGWTWTGDLDHWQTSTGTTWTKTGGTFTNYYTSLRMTGTCLITNGSGSYLYRFRVSGETTLDSDLGTYDYNGTDSQFTIDVTGHLIINSGYTTILWPAMNTISIAGPISGLGTLSFRVVATGAADVNMQAIGAAITVSEIIFFSTGGGAVNHTLSMIEDLAFPSSTVQVDSGDPVFTMTLDLNGKSLSATSITASARGKISSSVAGASMTAPAGIVASADGTIDFTNISAIGTISCTGAGTFIGTGTTALTIPAVASIPASAFAGITAIATVTIPSTVTSIAASAFSGCTALSSMLFLGSVAPTTVGDNWILNTNAGILGHAYVASDFPTPGNYFPAGEPDVVDRLTMGDVIPVEIIADDIHLTYQEMPR